MLVWLFLEPLAWLATHIKYGRKPHQKCPCASELLCSFRLWLGLAWHQLIWAYYRFVCSESVHLLLRLCSCGVVLFIVIFAIGYRAHCDGRLVVQDDTRVVDGNFTVHAALLQVFFAIGGASSE